LQQLTKDQLVVIY